VERRTPDTRTVTVNCTCGKHGGRVGRGGRPVRGEISDRRKMRSEGVKESIDKTSKSNLSHQAAVMRQWLLPYCMLLPSIRVSALHIMHGSYRALAASSVASRSRFLSSSAAAFVASAVLVWAQDPEECLASPSTTEANRSFQDNPRYIDREMQMQYGENSGT
jgi:hypothetical protein